jgi:hypothetical protein
MIGTGVIETANVPDFAFFTHWTCFGVAPAEGAVLSRYDVNVSFFLTNLSAAGVWRSCVKISAGPQAEPWGFLHNGNAVYVGRGQGPGDCVSDTWSTAMPSNMTAVSVCIDDNTRPVFASQYTPRYFAGGNVLQWSTEPSKSLFEIPFSCDF